VANRLTQVAVETLQQGGNPNARLTQVAVEALQTGGNPGVRVTQVAVETLDRIGVLAAADVRQTQAVLEHADFPFADVRETQAALEHVGFPPNAIWQTQACLEVLFPAEDFVEPPVGVRNYAYTGLLART
jgi:hypothetical protein